MAESSLVSLSMQEFIDRLASDAPTPGGGAVAGGAPFFAIAKGGGPDAECKLDRPPPIAPQWMGHPARVRRSRGREPTDPSCDQVVTGLAPGALIVVRLSCEAAPADSCESRH